MSSKRAAPEEREGARKRPRSSFSKVVKVLVGPDSGVQDIIVVHEDLICRKSPFFEAACKKEWAPSGGEEKELVIPLPDHEPETFRLYLECLYNPEADLFELSGGLYQVDDSDEAVYEQYEAALDIVCKLWILADYLGDIRLANAVIHLLASAHCQGELLCFTAATLEHIAVSTSEKSLLQRFTVDLLASTFEKADVASLYGRNWPPKFLLRIFRALTTLRGEEKSRRIDVYLRTTPRDPISM